MDHSWSSGKNFFEGCVGLRGPSERHLSEGETGEWRGYLTVVLDCLELFLSLCRRCRPPPWPSSDLSSSAEVAEKEGRNLHVVCLDLTKTSQLLPQQRCVLRAFSDSSKVTSTWLKWRSSQAMQKHFHHLGKVDWKILACFTRHHQHWSRQWSATLYTGLEAAGGPRPKTLLPPWDCLHWHCAMVGITPVCFTSLTLLYHEMMHWRRTMSTRS